MRSDGERERAARVGLARTMVFYSILAGGGVLLLVYILRGPPQGLGWASLTFVAVVTGLLAYQIVQLARDIIDANTMEVSGPVARKFQRAEMIIVWQSNFVIVGRRMFKLEPLDFEPLKEGDEVVVRYFHRTGSVVSVTKLIPASRGLEDE
jgi:hypothetical protein